MKDAIAFKKKGFCRKPAERAPDRSLGWSEAKHPELGETPGQRPTHHASPRSGRQTIIYRPLRGLGRLVTVDLGFRATRSTPGYILTPAAAG
jgi:hypothetical protein